MIVSSFRRNMVSQSDGGKEQRASPKLTRVRLREVCAMRADEFVDQSG